MNLFKLKHILIKNIEIQNEIMYHKNDIKFIKTHNNNIN